jgi:hypothetical protein
VLVGGGVAVEVLVGRGVRVGIGEGVELGKGGVWVGSTVPDIGSKAWLLEAGGGPEYSLKFSVESGTSDMDMNPR